MDDKTQETVLASLKTQMDAIQALLKERSDPTLHMKAPANFGTYTELHGNGSLFGSFPVEREVISMHMNALPGLINYIPRLPSVTENPIFASITGITNAAGNEPAYPCSDAPAGYMKGCNLTAMFGRYARDTQTIEIDDVMNTFNRGDFRDLVLYGQLLSGGPMQPVQSQADALNVVTKSEMIIAGVNLERLLRRQFWTGNPANSNAGRGYIEFPGLDRQIATGIIDAHTGVACPALDSDVKNFNYALIDGVVRDIVEYVSMLEFYLTTVAEGTGLDPVQWAFVMRPNLWHELSAVWPCRYMTNKCANSAGNNPVIINDNVNIETRDAMRNGNYIDVNGHRYPVITDSGIFEHNNINNANLPAGRYASTIYMVPLNVNGGFPVTYFEYKDFRKSQPDVGLLNGKEQFWWSDSGVYLWALEQVKTCLKLQVKIQPRVILRTPGLAGRIDAVAYQPLQHTRDWDPTSSYWLDGGVSLRANSLFHQVWGDTRL